jgi:hypothetical protein
MPTTTNIVSSNHVHGEVYSIQHYVIKFVSDLQQVGGFLWTLISSTKKTDHHDITEILLKVTFSTINLNQATFEERTGKCLRQVEHICGHLWHRYSITVNKVMVATVKLSKWWVQLNHCWHVLFVWLKFPWSGLKVLKKTDLMWDTFKI